MLRTAITGNIASGKSQAEKILSDMGYPVYDTDKIAHDVLDEITDFYGYDVFTEGKIDRKKLGDLVFANPDLKQKLEKIVHPKVKEKIMEIFTRHFADKYIFVSVPLLYEAGFEDLFDKVIMITVEPHIQLERLMRRNNFTEDEALRRINSQIPQEEKIKKADIVISNNGTFEDLKTELIRVVQSRLS